MITAVCFALCRERSEKKARAAFYGCAGRPVSRLGVSGVFVGAAAGVFVTAGFGGGRMSSEVPGAPSRPHEKRATVLLSHLYT